MMTRTPERESCTAPYRHRTLYLLLLTGITAAFCAWVLSLPLFPSQDGPIHLYYTSILHDLLVHASPLYARFYVIKHVLPPYSLYYYLLMLVSQMASITFADKFAVCLYMVAFAFGMRYLATSIGPNGDVTALLATPLLLNWPLLMGFVNFCLSTAFALWAMGLWCRSSLHASHAKRILFVLFAYVIMLTHPVPLLFLLGFCGLELLLRAVRERRSAHAEKHSGHLVGDALYLAAAACTLLYVRLFTAAHVLAQQQHATASRLHVFLFDLTNYLLMRTLGAFSGHALLDSAHRLTLLLLLFGALLLAGRQLRRDRAAQRWTLADTWTVLAFVAVVGLPLVPNDLNHSHFFAYRLVLFVWITALVAASGYVTESRWVRPGAAVFSVFASALVLSMAHARIVPPALEIAQSLSRASMPRGQVGLILLSSNHERPDNLSFDPYLWAGAHLFRRTGSVLYDSPWLDLAIIPIGAQATMPTGRIDPELLEQYVELRAFLEGSPDAGSRMLSHVDFVLLDHGSAPVAAGLDPILASDKLHPWRCRPDGWYSLCLGGRAVTGLLPPQPRWGGDLR